MFDKKSFILGIVVVLFGFSVVWNFLMAKKLNNTAAAVQQIVNLINTNAKKAPTTPTE